MKRLCICLAGLCVAVLCYGQAHDLERSTPEAEGIPSDRVIAFFDSLMSVPGVDIHSTMILRHGKVVAEIYPEPFRAEYGHQLFSCSKTFTAAAVGLAIADNRLRLDDRLAAFFPELLPDTVSGWLADITVRDLLTMTSGFEVDRRMRTFRTDWVRAYLNHPMAAEPGKRFAYDSINTYLLSAIVQRVTGMKIIDYLKQRIFTPLHITEAYWEESPEGINAGGWGLYLQPESLAKFGQLLLNNGRWNGEQLLPASWVKEMTSRQVDNAIGDDYGYQMWMCAYPGAVRADGAYGQYIILIPDKEMVVVITQCLRIGGDREQRWIWDGLLPYVSDKPLAVGKSYDRLKKAADRYAHTLPKGKARSGWAKQLQSKEFWLSDNSLDWQSIRFEFDNREIQMFVKDKQGKTSRVTLGYEEWKTSPILFYPLNARKSTLGSFSNVPKNFYVGGGYAWTGEKRLEIKLHFVNWMSAVGFDLDFENGKLSATLRNNYSDTLEKIEGAIR